MSLEQALTEAKRTSLLLDRFVCRRPGGLFGVSAVPGDDVVAVISGWRVEFLAR